MVEWVEWSGEGRMQEVVLLSEIQTTGSVMDSLYTISPRRVEFHSDAVKSWAAVYRSRYAIVLGCCVSWALFSRTRRYWSFCATIEASRSK